MSREDAEILWQMMQNESHNYMKGFAPFQSLSQLVQSIAAAEKDAYACLMLRDERAGFFMLRGLDAGYSRPSFGLYVASHASQNGIAAYGLHEAIEICNERKIAKIFLKVAKDNVIAKRLYAGVGFEVDGVCHDTGHITMEYETGI